MDFTQTSSPQLRWARFSVSSMCTDSLGDTLPYCAQQIKMLVDILREPGCSGDFNAISPKDGGLVDQNNLVDAWVALHGRAGPGGVMWGVGVERQDRLAKRCTLQLWQADEPTPEQ